MASLEASSSTKSVASALLSVSMETANTTELMDVVTAASITQTYQGEPRTADGCFIVQLGAPEPWLNPNDLISNDVIIDLNLSLSTILIPAFGILGIFGNAACALTFYRQGLNLALADLFNVFGYLCIQLEVVSRTEGGESYFFITYLLSLQGFTWVSMFLSTVIACERCFCVVHPFKAKQILKTSTMAVVIGVVSFLLLGVFVVIVGPKHTSACLFNPATNTTSSMVYVTDYYLDNKPVIDVIDVFFYTTAFPMFSILVIIFTTIITAVKLREAATWRRETANVKTSPRTRTMTMTSSSTTSSSISTIESSSSSQETKQGLSKREVAVTRMLIATSVLFIICTLPAVFGQIAIFSVPELKLGGQYHNTLNALWTVVSFLRVVNCSVNFFFYLYMGSKFRETLAEMLCCSPGAAASLKARAIKGLESSEST